MGGGCRNVFLGHMLEFDAYAGDAPAAIQRGYDEGHAWEQRVVEAGIAKATTDLKVGFRLLEPTRDLSIGKRSGNGVDGEMMPGYAGVHGGSGDDAEAGDEQVRLEVPVAGGRARIRCHIDGIAQVFTLAGMSHGVDHPSGLAIGDRVVVEAKFFGDAYWNKWMKGGYDTFPVYATQRDIIHMGSGLPILMVVGHKVRAPGDVDDVTLGEVDVRLVWPDASSQAKVRLRAMKVMAAYDQCVAEGVRDWSELLRVAGACDVDQYPCPFFQLHEDSTEVMREAGGVSLAGLQADIEVLSAMGEMAAAVEAIGDQAANYARTDAKLIAMRADMKLVEQAREKAKTELMRLVESIDRKGKRLQVGGYKVEYKDVPVAAEKEPRRGYVKKVVSVEEIKVEQSDEEAVKRMLT